MDLHFKGKKNGIASFLVETGEGPVLVETGPHSTYTRLSKEILRLGYSAEAVKHVFLTHIHLDHAGAAWCFAEHGAQIYVHPLGYKHLHDPSRLLASAIRIYGDEMDRLWGTLKPIASNLLSQVGHKETLHIGNTAFKAWHTPGHAKHHIAWQVDDALFTGDVAGVSIHNGPVIPPCPPPDIDIELWKKSLALIANLKNVNTYYLTHFGPVTNLNTHRRNLESALDTYASFIYPYYKSGKTYDDIVPQFGKFVQEFLVEGGMHPQDAASYEAANPSNMSVSGLLRYWSLKEPKN